MRLTSRYEDSDTNITNHKIKFTICHILNHIVHLRDSSRVSYILLKFKEDTNHINSLHKGQVKKSKVVPEVKGN